VSFECSYPEVLELPGKESRETALVSLRHGGDAHHVNAHPISPVERTAFPGKAEDRPHIRSPAFQDVDVSGRNEQGAADSTITGCRHHMIARPMGGLLVEREVALGQEAAPG